MTSAAGTVAKTSSPRQKFLGATKLLDTFSVSARNGRHYAFFAAGYLEQSRENFCVLIRT
jgi:hypothetical protein